MRTVALFLAFATLAACQPTDGPGGEPVPEPTEDAVTDAAPEAGDVAPGTTAPEFTLTAASGETVALADLRGKTVVLEWLNYGCPYVNKFYEAGEMQRLQAEYAGDDVVWLAVVSSAPGEQGHYDGPKMISETEKRGGNATAVLLDPTGETGRAYGAKTTPQMFVISPEGTVVYNGAIDDKPVTNPESLDGATNYLVGAMTALAEGREADPDRTEPYGCSVKYADA